MIEFPEDPIDVWMSRLRKFALYLMDEDFIISSGNMSNRPNPNKIVKSRIYFERLESEPDPNSLRGIAKQLRRLNERTHERFFPAVAFEVLKKAN